jgi:hypothetical protein
MIRQNLKFAFERVRPVVVKEIAAKACVPKGTIDSWVGTKEAEPKARDFYRVCRALGVTMEEIVDGEAGIMYVTTLVRERGGAWEPPNRIADIVDGLVELDDAQLDIIRGAMRPMLETKKGKETESTGKYGQAG